MENKITMLIIWIFLGLFIWWIDGEEKKQEKKLINYYRGEAIDYNELHTSIASTWNQEFTNEERVLIAPRFE